MNELFKRTKIEIELVLIFGGETEFKRIIYTNDKKKNLKISD